MTGTATGSVGQFGGLSSAAISQFPSSYGAELDYAGQLVSEAVYDNGYGSVVVDSLAESSETHLNAAFLDQQLLAHREDKERAQSMSSHSNSSTHSNPNRL
jgi:hypothetical protein